MTYLQVLSPRTLNESAELALRSARYLWFGVTVVGQWTFVYFIVAFFYVRTLSGNFAGWNDKPLIDGHIAGDTVGNLFFAAHVLMAAIMTAGGTGQLLPHLRHRWPRLHRINGRAFLLTAVLLGLGGLYMVWVRGTYLSTVAAAAISLDAALIVGFAAMTWRRAIERDFDAHRRWALRTFMVANGVWMLRVGFMFWAVTTGGAGMTSNMDGAFDVFWTFGNYLIPLLVLEGYLYVDAQGNGVARLAMATVVAVSSLAMAVGIAATYFIMWRPYL